MTTQLPNMGTRESIVVSFDFSRESAAVSGAVFDVWAEGQIAQDPTPLNIIDGAAEIDGSNPAVVLQRISNVKDSTNYRIQCTVNTIEGDTLTCPVILPARLKL